MEVPNKKGGILLLNPLALFSVMLILLDSSFSCGAAVLVKSNSSFRCDGRLEECMIAEDMELDFLMNPYVSRILADPPPAPSKDALDASKAAAKPCGDNDPRYCIDKPNPDNRRCSCTKGIYCKKDACSPKT